MSEIYNDEQIKMLLNKGLEERNTEVPPEFHKRVQETLDSLPNKNKTKKKIRLSMVAVAAMLIVSVTAVYGQDIVSTVIEFFKGTPVSDTNTYGKYAEKVGKTVTNNGISVTIDSVACDEDNIVLFYTAEGDNKEIAEVAPGIVIGAHGLMGNFKIDNNERMRILPKISREATYLTKDGKIKGICCADISKESLPDEFTLKFKGFSAMQKRGEWNFEFKISKNKAKESVTVFKPNKKYTLKLYGNESKVNIEKVSFTPFGNTLVVNEQLPKTNLPDKEAIDKVKPLSAFALFDDKGNALDVMCDNFEYSSKVSRNSFEFVKGNKDTKFLKLIPVEPQGGKEVTGIKDPAAGITALPTELKVSDRGSIMVQKVEFTDSDTKIYYTKKGYIYNWDGRGNYFYFKDSQGKDMFKNINDSIQYEYISDREKGVYVCVLPVVDKTKIAEICCHKDDNYNYLEDQAMIIPLTK